MANKRAQVGIVRGLAWTAVGGETLEVEVGIMPGNGKLLLTGKLGDVMKESAQIALTYVRSQTAKLVKDSYYAEHDIHIHVPEGAVPKDGPSAGVTMAIKSVSIRIEKERLNTLGFVADYEGRSINSHILVLILESMQAFENEHGKIEGSIQPDVNAKPAHKGY